MKLHMNFWINSKVYKGVKSIMVNFTKSLPSRGPEHCQGLLDRVCDIEIYTHKSYFLLSWQFYSHRPPILTKKSHFKGSRELGFTTNRFFERIFSR